MKFFIIGSLACLGVAKLEPQAREMSFDWQFKGKFAKKDWYIHRIGILNWFFESFLSFDWWILLISLVKDPNINEFSVILWGKEQWGWSHAWCTFMKELYVHDYEIYNSTKRKAHRQLKSGHLGHVTWVMTTARPFLTTTTTSGRWHHVSFCQGPERSDELMEDPCKVVRMPVLSQAGSCKCHN
jgi:hypothetical protein